jgi:Family of unknown function (DUF6498)
MVPSSLSVGLLIAVNLIPLVGVMFLGWGLFLIMVLYWLENGIIGLFNLPKIALASAPVGALPDGPILARTNALPGLPGRGFFMIFFAFHYGMFWVVHGIFVFALFRGSGSPFSRTGNPLAVELPGWWTLAAASLFLSHGVSFVTNFLGKREYLAVSPQQQMGEPYSRVVVLHVTILAGGFLVEILGTPVAALVLLVVLKTAIDVRAHLKEHRKAELRLDEASANDWSAWTETKR